MTDLPVISLKYENNMLAGSVTRQNRNYNWSEIENGFTEMGSFLQGVVDGYDLRINNMIANSTKVDEVVDARIDVHETNYATLKARLDAQQEASTGYIDTGVNSDSVAVLQVKDLDVYDSSNVANFSYQKIATLTDTTLPAMGYAQCSVANISTDVIGTV